MILLLIIVLIITNFILLLLYRSETNKEIKNFDKKFYELGDLFQEHVKLYIEYVERNNKIQQKMFTDYAGFQNEIMRYLKLEFGQDNSGRLQKIER